ncbi:hypothetical protein BCR34DRAFT_20162 [Clohesyomyces aquaticus]|uniref:Uncharacterized protein n=1 Tax=Clohesyomyces aquaticus TaxID=1231657 RepID=A0A1Y1ZAT4_9PLEO|nr:hypothetical protein BCR34DRAFT_20162 [Clohesyomyces aquaticus]
MNIPNQLRQGRVYALGFISQWIIPLDVVFIAMNSRTLFGLPLFAIALVSIFILVQLFRLIPESPHVKARKQSSRYTTEQNVAITRLEQIVSVVKAQKHLRSTKRYPIPLWIQYRRASVPVKPSSVDIEEALGQCENCLAHSTSACARHSVS